LLQLLRQKSVLSKVELIKLTFLAISKSDVSSVQHFFMEHVFETFAVILKQLVSKVNILIQWNISEGILLLALYMYA